MPADLIIIGGGAAGIGAARTARLHGASPVLVSDGPLGGDCTFTGCVPSKTLIAESRRGTPFADAIDIVAATIDRVAATESADVLRSEGIEVIGGTARLVGPGEVDVEGRVLTAEHVVVATGSRASVPPIDGLQDVPYLTNEDLFSVRTLPARFGVIGAGPIGAEMAMAFANFGSTVTVFEAADRVLPNEEPEASDVVAAAMAAGSIELRVGSSVERVDQHDRVITVHADGVPTEVDALLVATGRVASTDGLGLAEIGVELDRRGSVIVDEKLRTNVEGVLAAGDVTGLLPFTHAAYEQARMAVAHALGKGARWKYSTEATPWVTFTDPEVSRVGITESEVTTRGARVAHLPLEHLDRAITDGRTEGFVKLIAGPKTFTRNLFGGQLLGATIVAPRAGEMIHGPAIVARVGMFVGRLAQVTTPYPTWSNAVQQAAGQFFEDMNGLVARPARR